MATRRRVGGAAVALVVALAAGGCVNPAVPARPAPAPPAAITTPPVEHITYPVGLRILDLQRGHNRPLPTLVFYPAAGNEPARLDQRARSTAGWLSGGGPRAERMKRRETAARDELGWAVRPPAAGRFPLVLFCHGLSGSAERYAGTLAAWAAAGFVVAAPTFPNTSEFLKVHRPDMANQPADARYVLARVQALNRTPGDPLRNRIDTGHMAVIGHSAGGYTTSGLFGAGHDPRLRAAVIMAGWAAKGAFEGPPASVLFLQGKADPIVPVASSRALFARVPWPKSYLLMRHDSHATYLRPADPGYRRMNATVIAFLRWTLEGDDSGRRQIPATVYPAPADVELALPHTG
jgi:dienelactone hydrolase